MKIIVIIGDLIIGKYFVTEFSKYNNFEIIIEKRKRDKFKWLIKKLKKYPFLFPFRLIETLYLTFENRIMTKKIKRYFSNKIKPFRSYSINNINSKRTAELIKKLKPDIGIIIGTSILKNKIIKLFPKGILNLHTGILPHYRGVRSEFWALYNKDYDNIGSTIIKIDEGIDSGNVLLQNKVKVEPGDNEFILKCKNIENGVKLMIKAINNFDKLKIERQREGKYYSNPGFIDSLKFRFFK